MEAGRSETPADGATRPIARRAVVVTALVSGWSLLVAGYAWLGEPGWIDVTRHVVGTPSPGRRPLRIVQLADLHLRMLGARERRVAAAVTRERPDLLVLDGDLVDRPEGLPVLDAFLALLAPAPPTVAVLGSSERSSGVDPGSLRAVLAHRGGALLVDETLRLVHEGRPIAIVGLDDATTSAAPPGAAGVAGTAAVLALSHSPLARDSWRGPPASLLLAASTHGGQVSFLGYAPGLPQGSGRYLAGWYRGPPFDAYVSRGIGTSVLPIRFGARPEVAVFDWWPP